MDYVQLIIVAILVEAIWENLKMIWQEGKFNWNMIGSLIVSIVVCLVTGIDIFPVLGLGFTIPFAGSVATGIIVSRGSNFVHDIWSKISNMKGE